jgi:CubicO group peptidase (beta-lactamase class C family)
MKTSLRRNIFGRIVQRTCLLGVAMFASISSVPAQTENPIPITHGHQFALPALDQAMVESLQKIHCTAGTLAISRKGQLLYECGYGWLDQQRTVPAPPNAYIGVASCEKPITAAAVRQLGAKGKLDLNAPLFAALGIKPAGRMVDERVNRITFEHVLEHKAGWGGDIHGKLENLARASGFKPPFGIPVLLAYARAQPLEDEPGKVHKYSNFGFDVLRYVVRRFSGQNGGLYFREQLLLKSTCKEVGEPSELPAGQRAKRAVWNLNSGGPIFASAKYLCAFMDEYWLTGRHRDSGNPLWVMYGSLPGSTAIMIWRSDGINYAAVFNGRNETKHDDIRAALEQALKQSRQEYPERFSVSPPPKVVVSPAATAADRLKQLKEQLDKKIITQEDYDQRKKAILDSL